MGFAGAHHHRRAGALIGFLGPRVYEQLYGEPFPAGIQVAENLQRHGVIDGVVPLEELRDTLDRALKVLADAPEPPPPSPPAEPIPDVPAWDSVVASRRPDRPGVRHLLRHGCTEQVLLSGLQFGADQGEAATTLLALARFAGQPAVVLGQQRIVGGIVGPAALREARRGMALAAELRLPLVLVIDTAGPRCRPKPSRVGWPARLPAAWPTSSRWTHRRCRCCWARAAAGRHWRWCRRPGAGRTARLAGAAAAGGCQRDRLPRYRTRRGTGCGTRDPVGRPARVGHRRSDRRRAPRCRRRADRILQTACRRHRRRSACAARCARRRAHEDPAATLPPDRVALTVGGAQLGVPPAGGSFRQDRRHGHWCDLTPRAGCRRRL
ncbi:carboxyl transferase domain protein [Mycobacterium xenopi 4042]|uniref:Carboxyl transferase domain protein n=1 Tax=Mycobacterium xenopi 4042 TaxID=1299334 RepID=X8AG83_MYCXE|nr:carboxyl transferase domain protein [Mycobacterium xenopi 4042]